MYRANDLRRFGGSGWWQVKDGWWNWLSLVMIFFGGWLGFACFDWMVCDFFLLV